ncbi:MAG: hypothetical protein J6T67_06590 [Paludibacteraceae bacterium]|nr:hypothetical protein [Paludibacteraceae bacterium]
MKITKFFIVAFLPLSWGLHSCGDDNANAYEVGREVSFPEMSAEDRGTQSGETLAKALFSICDSVASANKKDLVPVNEITGDRKLADEPLFRGMLTSPLSKAQRPYELCVENALDSLWMKGFKTSMDKDLKLNSDKYTELMKLLAQIDFSDIDNADNANRCLEIEKLLK